MLMLACYIVTFIMAGTAGYVLGYISGSDAADSESFEVGMTAVEQVKESK